MVQIPPAQRRKVGLRKLFSFASRGSVHANLICEGALSCALEFNASLQQMMVLRVAASLSLIPANALNLFLVASIWRSY